MITTQKEKKEVRKEYLPPTIEIFIVEMEQGIAAQSAVVISTNVNNEVKEGWETGDDVSKELDW